MCKTKPTETICTNLCIILGTQQTQEQHEDWKFCCPRRQKCNYTKVVWAAKPINIVFHIYLIDLAIQ